VQLIRDRRVRGPEADPFAGITRVHESICYDFLASLLVLYSPRIFPEFRHWSAGVRRRLPAELWAEGRLFFQGHETCVGFGVVRIIPDLPHPDSLSGFISALRQTNPDTVALYMLEGPGALQPELLETFERLLAGTATLSRVRAALRSVAPARRQRFELVLTDPSGVRDRLANFLERYAELIFEPEVIRIQPPLSEAATKAAATLSVLPTVDAIERVTGGYTLATDLPLRRIVLAPSVFLYPAVACRIDDRKAEAFILFGVASPLVEGDDGGVPVSANVVSALRALSDSNRVRILRLVSERPRLTSELVSLLAMSQPAVHHHVRELWSAGLVRQERTRNGMLYSPLEDGLQAVISALSELRDGIRSKEGRSGNLTQLPHGER
jgi:DNA-binding transcriptional ArsR family regulator